MIGKDKIYEISSEVKNDRFFDDPEVQERLAKSIQSYTEGKTVTLSSKQLKDLLDI